MVVIPSIMLRPYTEDFLDGKNLTFVKVQTNKKLLCSEKYLFIKRSC